VVHEKEQLLQRKKLLMKQPKAPWNMACDK
jgi:hypothetical protein